MERSLQLSLVVLGRGELAAAGDKRSDTAIMKGREGAHRSKSHGRRVESGTSNSSEYGENMRLEGEIMVDGVVSEREERGVKGKADEERGCCRVEEDKRMRRIKG